MSSRGPVRGRGGLHRRCRPFDDRAVAPDGARHDDGDDEDVIQSGPARRGLPGWLWTVVAGVVGVAAGAGFMYNHDQDETARPDPSTPPSHAPASTPTPTERQPAVPDRSPSPRTVDQTGKRLLGATGDWELFARGPEVVVRIQPARGRVVRTAIPPLQSSGPVSFVVGADRAVVHPLDDVPGYVVPDDGRAHELAPILDRGGMVVPAPTPGKVWVFDDDENEMLLVTTAGKRTDTSISMPDGSTWPHSDGAGYLLVDSVGGVYQARPDGVRRVTTGTILASGPSGWLTDECDARLRCSRVLIEREGGARHVLGPTPAGEGVPVDDGVISPDGSTAAVVLGDNQGGSRLFLVDLDSGEGQEVDITFGQDRFRGVLAWSPDSRWLFTPSADGRLLAVDADTGRVRSLGVRLPSVDQVAVRAPSDS